MPQPLSSFRHRSVVSLICAASIGAMVFQAPHPVSAEPSDLDRLAAIEEHLKVIHDEARTTRMTAGGVTLGIGVLSGAGALYLLSLPTDGSFGEELGRALLLGALGGVAIACTATGLIVMGLRSDAETAPEEFEATVDAGELGAGELVVEGERVLRDLAEDARTTRYLAGGILASMPIVMVASTLTEDEGSPPWEAILPTAALFWGLAGLQFLIETTPEREWEHYQADFGGAGAESEEAASSAGGTWWVAPYGTADGLGLGAGATF